MVFVLTITTNITILTITIIKNTFQHEEDSLAFKYWSARMKKSNSEFFHRWMDDLRRRQNKVINDLQLRRKPLKSNFQKLFLKLGKIFDYFCVTGYNVFKLYMHNRVHSNLAKQKQTTKYNGKCISSRFQA